MTQYRSPSGRYWDWGAIVLAARAHPGKWVVRLPNERAAMTQAIKHRRSPALHLLDGTLEAKAVHIYVDEYGQRRADIYIRFTPAKRGEQ